METANDGILFGPIWVSKGERFRPTGAYIFLESRYKEFQIQLKKLKKEHKQLMIIINEKRKKKSMNKNETDDDEQDSSTEETDKEEIRSSIQDKSLLSMTMKEMKELQQVNKKITNQFRNF